MSRRWCLVSVVAWALSVAVSCFAQQTLTVPDDYPTIQAAIDAASLGDTVYVKAGYYKENLSIGKPVHLKGEGQGATWILPPDTSEPAIRAWLFEGTLHISDLSVRQASIGLFLAAYDAALVSAEGLRVLESEVGISALGSGAVSVARSYLVDNDIGVVAWASRTELTEVEFVEGTIGILLAGDGETSIRDCLIGAPEFGIGTYTVDCGWEADEFTGTVLGEGNRLVAVAMDLCPGSASSRWPEKFVDAAWRESVGRAIQLFENGLVAYQRQLFAYASRLWEESLRIVEQHPYAHLEAMIRLNMGGVHVLLADYGVAIRELSHARQYYEKRGMEYSVAAVDQNLGALYLDQGRYDDAWTALWGARTVFAERSMEAEVAGVEQNIGILFRRMGRYEEALSTYETALKVFRRLEMHTSVAEVRGNMGAVHLSLGRYWRAVEEFQVARAVFKREHRPIGVAMADHNIGLAHYHLALLDPSLLRTALSHLENARAIYAQHPAMEVYVARVNRNLGMVYSMLGWHARALAIYEDSRELFSRRNMSLKQAETSVNIAFALAQLERFDDALATYQTALSMLDAFPAVPGAAYSHPETRWVIHANMGSALESLGRVALAAQAYRQAIDVVETIREHLRTEQLKLALGERTRLVYEHYIDLLCRMDRGSEAFPYAERSRARTFLDILYEGGVNPEQLISAEAGVSAGVVDPVAVDEAIADALDRLEPGEAVLSYFVTERGVYLWVIAWEEGVGQHLLSEPLFLECERTALLGDVTEARILLETTGPSLGQRMRLEELLGRLYERLVQPGLAALPEGVDTLVLVPSGPLWYMPFAALPMTDQPYVPVGLSTRPRHLVEAYTVAYLPSVASLSVLLGLEDEVGEGLYMGLADPELTETQLRRLGVEMPYFEFLRGVAEDFAKCYTGKPAVVYVGAEATESRAHQEAPGHRVILYAAHGLFNPHVPLQSELYLAPGREQYVEGERRIPDGYYRAWEVLLTDHRGVELVVLAACESLLPALRDLREQQAVLSGKPVEDVELTTDQLEKIVVGDEVAGMARAFLSSGAHSVLGTLWQASPHAIAELLTSACGHYRRELSWAEALREAQIELIESDAYSDPWFWAPFQLIGRWR